MPRTILSKFNRGEVDRRALDRIDSEVVNDSCETMENFEPKRLGSMAYRRGTKHIGTLSALSRLIPFVAATDDRAVLDVDADTIIPYVDDAVITYPSTSMTITNGTFDSNDSSWTDASGSGSTAVWLTGGYASLTGAISTAATYWQQFGGSGFVQTHAIEIKILNAPVLVQIGVGNVANANGLFESWLGVGHHCLQIVATAQPCITISNNNSTRALVDSIVIKSGGTLTVDIDDTYRGQISDPDDIEFRQSGDVIYATANKDYGVFKIERRANNSWSVVDFDNRDGPFGLINATQTTMALTAASGSTTLTSSTPHFTADSVGDLYEIGAGQIVEVASLTAINHATNPIRMTGDTRLAIWVNNGVSATATVVLESSPDNSTWTIKDSHAFTGGAIEIDTGSYTSITDDPAVYFRIRCSAYTSGTVIAYLVVDTTATDEPPVSCRVTGFTSVTAVTVNVQGWGSTQATTNWKKGEWYGPNNYPSAVDLNEGRLCLAGQNKIWESASDAYESFDETIAGDSAPIRRTIGFGPVDVVYWLKSATRLLMGLASDIISVRSNGFGDYVTNSNVNLKSSSTQGASKVSPVKMDDSIIYAQRSGIKLIEAQYNMSNDNANESDLTILHENVCSAGIKRLAVARHPETRVYSVLEDGEMRVLLKDPVEEVNAWSQWTTGSAAGTSDHDIMDIIVMPSDTIEDEIYMKVKRGSSYYLEKMSRIRDMQEEHFDSAVVYTGNASATMTGLDHLDGFTVGVWGDDQDRGTATVSSGSITASGIYSEVVIGLLYNADYKSGKVNGGKNPLGMRKRILDVALSMLNYWPDSITIGDSFSNLDSMPDIEDGTDVVTTAIISEYDENPMPFNGNDEIDPRIFLRATGPCEILQMTYSVSQEDDQNDEELG